MKNINFYISDDSYEKIMRYKIYHGSRRLQEALDSILQEYESLKTDNEMLKKRIKN